MQCKKCSGILNPFARVDYRSKVWVCPICFNRNKSVLNGIRILISC